MQGDCLELMKDFPDETIDLTVTSPPYDNLRTYNGNIQGWSFDKFKGIAKELYRITKSGGVVVWVVADATIKGSETGTSFKQALFFKDCGFNIHDTMIFLKRNPVPLKSNRYQPSFEYMFVFSKGKPKTFNPILTDKKYVVDKKNKRFNRQPDGTYITKEYKSSSNKKVITNVWEYCVGFSSAKDKIAFGHPAIFPEKLARDHIISWSNVGDTVFDCFMGSGTTGVACVNTNRQFIGIELDKTYFEIANQRINDAVFSLQK